MTQKLADFIGALLGLRKTIVMFSLLIIGIAFRISNLINGAQLVDLLKATTIAFFAANSVERVGETVKTYINANGQKVTEKEETIGDTDKE